jgi:hypothetical protein
MLPLGGTARWAVALARQIASLGAAAGLLGMVSAEGALRATADLGMLGGSSPKPCQERSLR